jgi:hypothetical protein
VKRWNFSAFGLKNTWSSSTDWALSQAASSMKSERFLPSELKDTVL